MNGKNKKARWSLENQKATRHVNELERTNDLRLAAAMNSAKAAFQDACDAIQRWKHAIGTDEEIHARLAKEKHQNGYQALVKEIHHCEHMSAVYKALLGE